MIAGEQEVQSLESKTSDQIRIWGFSAVELHDAYWRGRGVQVVRAGQEERLRSDAELYLLIDPGHLVLFNLAELRDRLIWRDAQITRVRLVDEQQEDDYREEVQVDDEGLVRNIARRYRPRFRASYRLTLTSSRRFARMWMAADNARQAWLDVRRAVRWSSVDHVHVSGTGYNAHDPADELSLLDALVKEWANPGQVIEGIEEFAEDVWIPRGMRLADDVVAIGPIWLGDGVEVDDGTCMIGPAWRGDAGTGHEAYRLRDIFEIESDEDADTEQAEHSDRSMYQFTKRLFDIVVSFAALIVTLPIWAVVIVCILLEDGRPVFYSQVRESRGGRPFRCWKFRSMRKDADQIARQDASGNICDGPQVFIVNDPRVTRVGKVLRRFQIDEFPQFWNVLLGQMSIVGPRPSPKEENQMCPAWRELRLSVRPGITGLWQLNRTRQPGIDFQEWIKYDIEYVRNAGFGLDTRIFLRTAALMFRGRRR